MIEVWSCGTLGTVAARGTVDSLGPLVCTDSYMICQRLLISARRVEKSVQQTALHPSLWICREKVKWNGIYRIGISVCNVCLCQICPPHSANLVERHRVGIGDGWHSRSKRMQKGPKPRVTVRSIVQLDRPSHICRILQAIFFQQEHLVQTWMSFEG